MEKHIQTVLLSLITALVIGVGSISLNTYRQVGIMQYQLDEFSKRSGDYLTRSEAGMRGKMRDEQMTNLANRVSAIEARLH